MQTLNIDKMKDAILGLANRGISRAMNRASTRVVKSLGKIMNTMDALEDFVQSTINLIDERLEST